LFSLSKWSTVIAINFNFFLANERVDEDNLSKLLDKMITRIIVVERIEKGKEQTPEIT